MFQPKCVNFLADGRRKTKFPKHLSLRCPDTSESDDDDPSLHNNVATASNTSSRAPPLREFLQNLSALRIQVENHPLNASNTGIHFQTLVMSG